MLYDHKFKCKLLKKYLVWLTKIFVFALSKKKKSTQWKPEPMAFWNRVGGAAKTCFKWSISQLSPKFPQKPAHPVTTVLETHLSLSKKIEALMRKRETYPWNTILTLSLKLVAQGESTGGWLVNVVSNWDTSSSDVKVGSNGGLSFRLITSAQFMCLK